MITREVLNYTFQENRSMDAMMKKCKKILLTYMYVNVSLAKPWEWEWVFFDHILWNAATRKRVISHEVGWWSFEKKKPRLTSLRVNYLMKFIYLSRSLYRWRQFYRLWRISVSYICRLFGYCLSQVLAYLSYNKMVFLNFKRNGATCRLMTSSVVLLVNTYQH